MEHLIQLIFSMKLEIIRGDDRLIMCYFGYCSEDRLCGGRGGSRRPVRRPLRKRMVIVAAKIVKNGGVVEYGDRFC